MKLFTPQRAALTGLALVARRRRNKQRRTTALRIAAASAIAAGIGGLLASRRARNKTKGAVAEATAPIRHAGREYDDVTLARKVESEVFRSADAPKDTVSVNVADGVVELRGTVPEHGDALELASAAEKVDGVKAVNNLLTTAG
jgi:osmotically-inducible protein OsmY